MCKVCKAGCRWSVAARACWIASVIPSSLLTRPTLLDGTEQAADPPDPCLHRTSLRGLTPGPRVSHYAAPPAAQARQVVQWRRAKDRSPATAAAGGGSSSARRARNIYITDLHASYNVLVLVYIVTKI